MTKNAPLRSEQHLFVMRSEYLKANEAALVGYFRYKESESYYQINRKHTVEKRKGKQNDSRFYDEMFVIILSAARKIFSRIVACNNQIPYNK